VKGLYLTTNRGSTFTTLNSSAEFSEPSISTDALTVVAGYRLDDKVSVFRYSGTYANGAYSGGSWSETTTDVNGRNAYGFSHSAISSDGQRMAIGGIEGGNGLQTSSDGGSTWTRLVNLTVNDLGLSRDGYVMRYLADKWVSPSYVSRPYKNAAITTANLSSSSPADGATGVSPSGNVTLTFDTNIEAVSGKNIRIVKTSDSTTTTIDATDSSVTVSGTTVTIDPSSDLADSTAYHLLIDAGAFRVTGGGADYRGIYTATELNFTTGLSDITPPATPGTPNLDAASNLGQSSTDDLTADNTPSITVIATEAGGTVTVTAAKTGSSNVTCTLAGSTSGNSCTLGTLADGVWTLTAVHVDAAGNASSASSALSITIDTVAPTRTAVNPTDGSTGASTGVSPVITFNDTVISGGGNIVIYSGASCATTVTTIASSNAQVTISGSTVTINPTADFDQNTKHCIIYAASAFTDIAGNQVAALALAAGDSDFSFTTAADVTPPAAPGRPDLDAASDTGQSTSDNVTADNTPTVTVIAAEAGGTVTVTAAKTGSSNVTCTLSGNTSGASCTLGTLADGVWSLSAVHVDAAGNASSASSALSLTIDTVAPTISTYSPAQGATGVSRQPELGMTFSEPVYASGVGRVRLRDYNAASDVQTYAGDGSAVTISGATVTIDISAMLATNSLHNIAIDFVSPTGVFVDLAGNSFAGISLNTTWQFTTTTDGTAPTATWSEPATPSSSRTLSYGLAFSESVSGLTSADFTNTGTATGCTFSPSASSGTTFTVSVSCSSDGTVVLRLISGAVTDAATNEGPLTDTDATSVTIASPPPAAPTTTTTIPSTSRTLSISGAASSYLVTQSGPGLTAAPSAGGGAISWSSLTPGVCSIGSVAMMSILSKQSSVSVGRLNTVGTCSIRATIAATSTHDAASSTVSFAVTRIRPTLRLTVRELSPEDQFFLRITLPAAVASNVTLLEQMYAAVNFESTTPDACEVDIITAYDESIARYGSSWAGVHVSVNRFGSDACGVRAELPLGVRWFRVSSDPAMMSGTSTTTTSTTVSPTTTVAVTASTVPGSSTTVAGSAVTVATTAPSSATTAPSGEPSLTSFAPTPTTVPVVELDLAAQIIIDMDVTRIVISGDSIESSARELNVTTGFVRIRPNTGEWTQVSLPRPADVTIVLTAETSSLDVRFEPLDGEPILVSVPLAIVVSDSQTWLYALVAFVLGSGATVFWFAAAKRRRRKELPPPVA
jgi:methionine-rich copper-binding protein CopC